MKHSLKKYTKKIPGMIFAYISIDSWRLAGNEQKITKVEQEYQSKIDQLTMNNYNNEIASSSQKIKYEALAERVKESDDEMTRLENGFNELSSRFNKAGLNNEEKAVLLNDMKRNLDNKADISKKISNEFKDIIENFDKNDIFGPIQQLIDNYREYISHLDAEHLGIITNCIGFLIIISTVNSLIITYYGNVIINYLNLELKYPKLAKFIQIRAKFTDKLIKLDILYIYLTAVTMLAVNIYMFFI